MFIVSMLLLRVPQIPRNSKCEISGQEWWEETPKGLVIPRFDAFRSYSVGTRGLSSLQIERVQTYPSVYLL